MKKLSFYEQVGVVIPGAILLFGAMFYVPALYELFSKNGVSVGGLGIFVIISYGTGHLLARLGNAIDHLYWAIWGGLPSNWVIGKNPRLLSPVQLEKLPRLIEARFGYTLQPLEDISKRDWFAIFRQIYSDVERSGDKNRAEIFNGNYGLNRGLCAAALALAAFILIVDPPHFKIPLALLLVCITYLWRMHRFGVHYAREVFNQFLLLPLEPTTSKKARVKKAKASPATPVQTTSPSP